MHNRDVPTKHEQRRRKQIRHQLRANELDQSLATLPAPQRTLREMLNYVDERLSEGGCDQTLRLTLEFVQCRQIDPVALQSWLADHGGLLRL